jgi:MFS family permease
VFCGVLLWSIAWPLVVLFLLAMGVWGIYYEFLGFGGQAFVAESVPPTARSGVWAIMSAFRSLAYFIGPVVGSYLALTKGDYWVVMVATLCVALGYLIWALMEEIKRGGGRRTGGKGKHTKRNHTGGL